MDEACSHQGGVDRRLLAGDLQFSYRHLVFQRCAIPSRRRNESKKRTQGRSKTGLGVMEYSAMMRPRYSSGIKVCMVVLAEAICRITLYPMTGMIASDK